MSAPGRPSIGFLIVLAICAAAPTVGDVGGCGASAETLDAQKFFAQRLDLECQRCSECGLSTPTCKNACNPKAPRPLSFPEGCHPVVHDGEVCLRALEALSCSGFADVVDPDPIVPSECDFCPASAATSATP